MKMEEKMPPTAATQTTDTCAVQFQFVQFALPINLADISEEEARVRPDPGANSVNWIVGHMVSARQNLLSTFGQGPFLPAESIEYYRRGSKPGDAEAPQSLASLVAAYQQSQ